MTDDQARALRLSWDRFLTRWDIFLSLLTILQGIIFLHNLVRSRAHRGVTESPAGQGRGMQAIGTHTETQKDPQELSASHHYHCCPCPSEISHCLLPGGREEGKRWVNNYRCLGIKSNQQVEMNSTMVSHIAYTVSPKLWWCPPIPSNPPAYMVFLGMSFALSFSFTFWGDFTVSYGSCRKWVGIACCSQCP